MEQPLSIQQWKYGEINRYRNVFYWLRKKEIKMHELIIWVASFKVLPLEKLLIAEKEMDKFIVYATSQGIHCKNIQE